MQPLLEELGVTDGERLKNARLKARLSQREVGEMIGVSREAVASYESDRSRVPDGLIDRLEDLESPIGKSVRGRPGVLIDPDRSVAEGFAVTMAIPGYRGVLAAGKFDEEPFFEEADAFEVPTAFLVGGTRNANLHVVIQVSGASMEPRIASGERIVVYMDPTPIPNGIMFVESPEGKKFLKTVRSQGDGTYGLASINQAGAKLKLAEGWTAIGYAVAIIGHGGAGVRNIEWDNGRPLRAA